MKITLSQIPALSIEEFADKHDLEMLISERELPVGHPSRFYARFRDCEIKGDGVLISTFGNGKTPEEAIQAYAKEITMQPLVIGSYSLTRREIRPHRIKLNEDDNA